MKAKLHAEEVVDRFKVARGTEPLISSKSKAFLAKSSDNLLKKKRENI